MDSLCGGQSLAVKIGFHVWRLSLDVALEGRQRCNPDHDDTKLIRQFSTHMTCLSTDIPEPLHLHAIAMQNVSKPYLRHQGTES